MDTIKFVEQSLNESNERLVKSLSDLSPENLVWRPVPNANCIFEIIWHVARVNDRTISRIEQESELWESQKWYLRFNYPQELPVGNDYETLKELKLSPPELENVLAYIDALHKNALDKLHNLSPDDLDIAPNPSNPERTIGVSLRHLIVHINNHHGQIDYVRGLIQKDWNLPPGTGIIQP
ncbi:DinB family protein [Chloroflexota bacterium]